MQCHKYFLHSFYQNIWLLIKMAFFLRQNIVKHLQVKREVEMVRLHIAAFMKSQVLLLNLITSYMFVIEVLVL